MRGKRYVFLLSAAVTSYIGLGVERSGETSLEPKKTVYTKEVIDTLHVFKRTTQYNPSRRQTDSRPLETADQSWINLDSLKAKTIQWCAVSRDMLVKNGGPYNYGDTLELIFAKNPELNGKWIIHDTMNRRYKRTIDLLVHKDNKIRLYRKNNAISISRKTITWEN